MMAKERFQGFSFTPEERVAPDNPGRVIDALVKVLPREKMGLAE